MGKRRIKWQSWEDQILADYLLVEGTSGCHIRLPHRTRSSIQHRAQKLGLQGKLNLNDLTGNIYGVYKVIKRGNNHVSPKGRQDVQWWIKCTKCGAEKLVFAVSLVRGGYNHCSNCTQLEIGKRYNKWLEPIERIKDDIDDKSGQHRQRFLVKCHYGAEGCKGTFPVRADSVLSGDTKSCGCSNREKSRERFLKERNPNWKEEGTHTTPLANRYYRSAQYCQMKDRTFKRDNYCCIVLGKLPRKLLTIHHIVPRNYYFKKYNITTWEDVFNCKELWDLDNVVTISEEWHIGIKIDNPKALHKIYSGRTYIEEDYYTWLKETKDLTVNE